MTGFGMNSQTSRRYAHRPLLAQHDAVAEVYFPIIGHLVHVNLVVVATRDIQCLAVGRIGQSVPTAADGLVVHLYLLFGVKHLDTLTTVAVVGHGQPPSVGRHGHVQREVSQR